MAGHTVEGLSKLLAQIEREKQIAESLTKQLSERDAQVTTLARTIADLQADANAEAKQRVELQITLGEFETRLKPLVSFMQKAQQKAKEEKDTKTAADGKVVDAKAGGDAVVVVKYGKRTGSTYNPEQIVDRVASGFARIRQLRAAAQSGRQVPDFEADPKLVVSIRATPVDEYPSFQAKMMVGQYLSLASSLMGQAAKSKAEQLAIVNAAVADGPLLYHLFTIPPNAPDATDSDRAESEMLQMDVATRLRIPKVLSDLFQRAAKRGFDKLQAANQYILFMTAASLLGEWSALLDIGKALIKSGEDMKELHNVAMQQPGFPDLEQLYRLATVEGGKPRPTPPLSDIKWAEYKITSSILKLKKLDCPDAEAAAAISNDFKDHPEGKELCSPDAIHKLLRCGAHAVYIATGATAMPVVGPADDKEMDLHGWIEMKNGANSMDLTGRGLTENGGITRQEEVYRLKFKSADAAAKTQTWSGFYSMINNVTDPNGPGLSLKCEFDATIVIEEVPFGSA